MNSVGVGLGAGESEGEISFIQQELSNSIIGSSNTEQAEK